jgi:glutaredoxin
LENEIAKELLNENGLENAEIDREKMLQRKKYKKESKKYRFMR